MRLEPMDLSLIGKDEGCFGNGPYGVNGKNSVLRFSLEELATHFLFLGSTGTGKTNAICHVVRILKDSIMTGNDVMIVFDTKGDYYKEFYEESKGDLVISNENVKESNPQQIWNVFEDVVADGDSDLDQNAREIARTIYDERVRLAKEPFFPQAAADLTWAVMIALLREAKERNKTVSNQDLVQVLGNGNSVEISALLERYEDLRGASQYISLPASGQTQGVISELRRIVNDVLVGVFGKAGSFSIRNFVRQRSGRTLFIEYDLKWGRILTPIYRLLIDLAIKESLTRSNENNGNVFFIIDEFALLPNLYHIDDGINFGRQQGAKFIVGTQNISQLLQAYGEGRAKSILSNFGTLFAFRLNDQDSRNLVAGRYGKYRVKLTLPSPVPSEPLSHHIVESDVLEPLALSLLSTGCCIICSSGIKPRLFQFGGYRKRTETSHNMPMRTLKNRTPTPQLSLRAGGAVAANLGQKKPCWNCGRRLESSAKFCRYCASKQK